MNDSVKEFSELPAGADITKPEWSWYFDDKGNKGAIRHTIYDKGNGYVTTEYPFPCAVVQVIKAVSGHDVFVLQNTIKRALGICDGGAQRVEPKEPPQGHYLISPKNGATPYTSNVAPDSWELRECDIQWVPDAPTESKLEQPAC